MTLTELEALLAARVTPEGLALSRSLSDGLDPVLRPLGMAVLQVREPQVARTNGTLTVTGRADALGAAGAALTLTATGEAAPEFLLRLDLPGHWAMDHAFTLPGSYRADPEHAPASRLQRSLLADLAISGARVESGGGGPARLSARAPIPGEYARLRDRLGLAGDLDAAGTLDATLPDAPAVDLVLGTPAALAVGSLRVEGVGLHLRTVPAGGGEPALTVLQAEGTVRIGTTDPVEVRVTASCEADEDVFAFRATARPGEVTVSRGAGALAEWMGGDADEFRLPPGLDVLDAFSLRSLDAEVDAGAGRVSALGVHVASDRTWTPFSGLVVSDLFVRWRVLFPFGPERTMMVGLGGTATLGTTRPVRFDLSVAGPAPWTLAGDLRPGDAVDLAGLAADALGLHAGLPSLEIDALSLAATTDGDLRLAGSVTSDWTLDLGGGRSLGLTRVTFALARRGGVASGAVRARMDVAGTTLFLAAETAGGGTGLEVSGGTWPGTAPIHLSGVVAWALERFGATLPSSVPDVTLGELRVSFNTATKAFHFQGQTDVPIPVPFMAGDGGSIHAAANLTSAVDAASGRRVLSGWMEGDLLIGNARFTLRYELGQAAHVFEASWQATATSGMLGVQTLLDAIGAQGVQVPAGVDLNLARVYLRYQAETRALTLVADSATYGEAFLVAQRPVAADGTDGAWQWVFGVAYEGTTKLSAIPVLGSALGGADLFTFRELGILVSSGHWDTFSVPALPPLTLLGAGAPAAAPRSPVAAGATLSPLPAGVAVLGVIDLASHGGGADVEALRSVLPADTLTVSAAYDAEQKNFSLRATLDGAVTIPTGGAGGLRIGDATVELDFPNPVAFKVSGSLVFSIDHHTIRARPALVVSEEGVELVLPVDFVGGWPAPMGIEGLTLDDIDLALGVNFIPAPGVNIGLQGAAHIGTEAPRADQFAFVLEIVEEIPDPLLLSFQAAEISVSEVLAAFAPRAEHALPDWLTRLRFVDVGFFWAESVVVMPDGTTARPGLAFHGGVQVLDFQAYAALSIDATGIAGELMLAPIHVGGVLDLTGSGAGVFRSQHGGQSVAPTVLPGKSPAPAERVQLVAPGGPVVQFRTHQSPWLYASIHASLFGAVSADVEALISSEGVHFLLRAAITDAVVAELDCTVSKSGLAAHAEFGVHLRADLGPIRILGQDLGTIHLDAGFDLKMALEVTAGHFLLKLDGDFEFEGARLTFPTLRIEVAPSSLAELPERLIRHLGENLEHVFADLFAEAGRLLEEAAREVEEAAEAVAREVEKAGEAALEEAKRIAEAAEQAVERAAHEVAAEAERVEKEAEEIARAAAEEVAAVARAAEQEVERIAAEVAEVARKAEQEIEAIGAEIGREAVAVEQAVVQVAQAALAEVERIGRAVEAEVQQLLADARRAAESVIAAARQVVQALEHEAEALWNEAKRLAEAAADALRRAAEAVEHAAESAWNTIKKY